MTRRQNYPSDMAFKFVLRMPNGLHARIKELADSNRRSLNSEIVVLLERAVFDQLEYPDQSSRPSPASGQLAPVST